MSGPDPKRVVLVVLLVALVLAVFGLGVAAGASNDDSYDPGGFGWLDSMLGAVPGLIDTLEPSDVAGEPCVDGASLVGCTSLQIPDGTDQLVLTGIAPLCLVELRHPDEIDQQLDRGDVDDAGRLRVPVVADGSVLRFVALGDTVCSATIQGSS